MGSKMAWSKSTRIKVMIAIDTAFFLLELICGFLAHSLALTADAFHMLNDIISLIIGLWAVVAAQKATTDEFTFGWVRAEILGAFFNAVFLIALCVSIILEALTRFVEPPEIDQPKLILIVGCAGLVSNLLGFVVLGGHGHSHGDEEDGHDHSHAVDEGRPSDSLRRNVADEDGVVGDVLPEVIARRATQSSETARRIRFGDDTAARDDSNGQNRTTPQARGRARRRSSKSGHSRFQSIEDMSIHPASFRQDIIAASLAASSGAGIVAGSDTSEDYRVGDSETDANEESPLLVGGGQGNNGTISHSHSHSASQKRPRRDSSVHDGHNHTLPRKAGAKASGHNHADMGMNAMMLHVLGDALGNVGVIITALIIWLTDWPGKLYSDPAVSLVITAIILKTSIPLTRATARVLLQATPENISIQDIRQDIEGLPGVVSCHHIHVWQLSDTKVVASMHLQVAFPINEHSGEKYMQLAKRARKCLHGYGIHSATIQPEFCLDQQHRHAGDAAALRMDGCLDGTGENTCLLNCIDDCRGQACCPGGDVSSKASSTRRGSDASPHGDGHQH
ncbi:zinc homeostasis factor 1 [Metarhizium album ARSEF 1941]|uniref:Zinc homeostasis factor 1 n=1 Tax=Metarhizium album (strain ARSEF 1941) TaxID=1081103 RepID=A0A0B2WT92_METAS|nr:zinc homeostasis factor 1 [Metarhizium album ARSEF 1941]KHN96859.1 zinc homeostasis factor 1 [Metarhizium album ARSEF 1941]